MDDAEIAANVAARAMGDRVAFLQQQNAKLSAENARLRQLVYSPDAPCEHCEPGERCKGYCNYCYRIDAVYEKLIDLMPLKTEEFCRNISIAAVDALEPEIRGLEVLVAAIVSTAGGIVEEQPTGKHNILQRIRALRDLEDWLDAPIDEAGHE